MSASFSFLLRNAALIVFILLSYASGAKADRLISIPEEYYKAEKQRFNQQFAFMKNTVRVENYRESFVYLKNISDPIAVNILFDIIHPGISRGYWVTPSISMVTYSPYKSSYTALERNGKSVAGSVRLNPLYVVKPDSFHIQAGSEKTSLSLVYSGPRFAQEPLYYSLEKNTVCFSDEKYWVKNRAAGASMESLLPLSEKWELLVDLPYYADRKDFSFKPYYHMGIFPVYASADFFVDEGERLEQVMDKAQSSLRKLENWTRTQESRDPAIIFQKAGYSRCPVPQEAWDNNIKGYTGENPTCFCLSQ